MKALFAIAAASVLPFSAFAKSFELPEGSLSLETFSLSYVQILKVEQIAGATNGCGPGAHPGMLCPAVMVPPSTEITLGFTLMGCMDTLGPVSVNHTELNGRQFLQVLAFNVRNEKSMLVDCRAAPVAEKTIKVLGTFEKSDFTIFAGFAQ